MSNSVATRIIDFIEPKLNRRSVAFTLCLLLSGLFWLLLSLSENYVDEVVISVEYNNIPDDVLIGNSVTQEVTAEVRGIGFDLLWYWLQFEKLRIPVNAVPGGLPSVIRKGEELHYVVTAENSNRIASAKENQLEIISISPDTLFLKFTDKFIKQVPVKLHSELSFAKQFGMVSNPTLVPDSVMLIGARKDVDSISYVVTELLSRTDLNESVTTDLRLRPFQNLPFVRLSQSSVQVELNIVEFTEGSVTIPIQILAEEPESVKLFPSEVEIKYQVPLADYDKVEDSQFRATVVLNQLHLDQTTLVVTLDKQPDMVSRIRINPAQVEYIIQQ